MHRPSLPIRAPARPPGRAALALLAVLLAAALATQPAAAQTPPRQLDQSQTGQAFLVGAHSNNRPFQTFTAGLTGGLDQVDLPLAWLNTVGAGTVTISIVTVGVGGVPTTTALASTTVPAASLPVFTGLPIPFTSFALSPAAPVVAGTQYAIRVSAMVPVPSSIVW